jgi:hypothetical protein
MQDAPLHSTIWRLGISPHAENAEARRGMHPEQQISFETHL